MLSFVEFSIRHVTMNARLKVNSLLAVGSPFSRPKQSIPERCGVEFHSHEVSYSTRHVTTLERLTIGVLRSLLAVFPVGCQYGASQLGVPQHCLPTYQHLPEIEKRVSAVRNDITNSNVVWLSSISLHKPPCGLLCCQNISLHLDRLCFPYAIEELEGTHEGIGTLADATHRWPILEGRSTIRIRFYAVMEWIEIEARISR